MPNTKQLVTATVDIEVARQLRELAARQRRPFSWCINDALHAGLTAGTKMELLEARTGQLQHRVHQLESGMQVVGKYLDQAGGA